MSYNFILEDNKKKTYFNKSGGTLNSNFIIDDSTKKYCLPSVIPKFSEYLNYQLTLARMDAIDELEGRGIGNMGDGESLVNSYTDVLKTLEKAYAKKKSRESLEEITTADDFHRELYKLENGLVGVVKNKIKDFFMLPEIVLSSDTIEDRQQLQSYDHIFLSKH